MRIVNVSIDLVIDDTIDILNSAPSGSNNYYYDGSYYDKTKIADYLNDKIYQLMSSINANNMFLDN